MLTKDETYTMRGGGATKKLFVALFVALLAALMLTPPAFGAVTPSNQSIEVDYGIEFVVLDGYPVNTNVRVDVIRGPGEGVVVGSTTQRTNSTGHLEINHLGGGQFGAGGDCWGPSTLNPNAPNVTPDILPGDKVQTTILNADGTPRDPADVDFTIARDIFIDQGATTVDTANNTITMEGHVRSTADAPINIAGDVLELRLNAPFDWDVTPENPRDGRSDLRAQVSPDDFAADLDGDDTTFKHVFNVTQNDVERAGDLSGIEQIFEWSAGLAGNELIVFSGTEETPGCPPRATTNAVTDFSHTVTGKRVVNSNNVANDMVVGGPANGAETVSVSIAGGPSHAGTLTPAFDAANPNVNQTWTATIPKDELASLPQGPFDITASFTGPGVPASITLSAKKDTENPAAPTADRTPGRYPAGTAVRLFDSDTDPDAKIRYRSTDTGTPTDPDSNNDPIFTPTSAAFQTPITIKAVVIDGAGNVSPVATFAYTTGVNTAPAAPTIGIATAGNASATVNWTPPDNGGSAITRYDVQVRNVNTGNNVGALRTAGANATQLNITGLNNGTRYQFRVRAVNAVGNGTYSAFSNTVTPSATAGGGTGGGTTVLPPSQPLNVTAAQDAAGTAGVAARANWEAPADNGGSAITQYRVKAIRVNQAGTPLGAQQQPTNPFMTAAASARTLRFTGLVRDAFYKFEVQASNTPAGQTKVWGAAALSNNQVAAR